MAFDNPRIPVRGLSQSARLVWLELDRRAGANGATCWPSVARIGFDLDMPPRTVLRALRELEGAMVVVSWWAGGHKAYRLRRRIGRNQPKRGMTPRHLGGDTTSPQGVTPRHPKEELERGRERADPPEWGALAAAIGGTQSRPAGR